MYCGCLVAQAVKKLPAMQERHGFGPWIRKILGRRGWQPTPVFLPGEFQEQRNLVGYSPWGHKELDTNEQLTHSQGGGRVGRGWPGSLGLADATITHGMNK